jgi:curved DNA-binding protein CbpA
MRLQRDIDFYAVLNLSPGAVQDDLRKAYLKLALLYHPDRNPGNPAAEERFKAISQAYAVLSNPLARDRYDRLRRSASRSRTHHVFSGGHPARGTRASAAATGTRPRPGSEWSGQSAAYSSAQHTKTQRPTAASATARASGVFQEPGASAGPRPKTRPSTERPKRHTQPPDIEDLMTDLFKTKAGQESLNKVEVELNQAGLGVAFDRLFGQFKQAVTDPVKNSAGNFFKRLKDGFFAPPVVEDQVPPEDIVFGLALSPEAAASGTTIDLSYTRDNKPHRLKVKIPAGVEDNFRLKLTGQGHRSPNGRGDLHLRLTVQKPDS